MGAVHRRVGNDRPLSRAIVEAQERGTVPIVADIKPVSPRDGDLLQRRDPAALARSLAAAGACALSVVTESEHFGGSIAMLEEVAEAVPLPVLRKDFFSAPRQITESAEARAAAVLIIMATTPDPLAAALYQQALAVGLEAVVEVHTRDELDRALALKPTIIGINNRNILGLEKDEGDVRVTEELAPLVPSSIVILSESSLRSAQDVRRALAAGADAVLIGTALLRTADPGSSLAGLVP